MRHASFFSGIGGFDLAAEWMGWENVFMVEKDPWCQRILRKNFKNVEIYGDIKEFNGEDYSGSIDIVSGGFPCQPFSNAGKRKGESDDRYLWPEYLRVIREIQPTYVVGENVAGLVTMEDGKTLDRILTDLEDEGYTVESFLIPACGVGAWHRRERIWICGVISNPDSNGDSRGLDTGGMGSKTTGGKGENQCQGGSPHGERLRDELEPSGEDVPDTKGERQQSQQIGTKKFHSSEGQELLCGSRDANGIRSEWEYWATEPLLGRMANGIPNRVDRLRGLGNAIVPQVAYELFRTIETLDNETRS
jgi:DNA (cytosine-5)-methyltransferase 1